IRENIVFARHNVINDAPFTRLELLCCRNLMIYLTLELQKQIIPVFHYSLNARGIYFMGPAETLGGFTDMFRVLDSRWKIYERKEGVAAFGKMIDFPFNISRNLHNTSKSDYIEKTSHKKTLEDAFNQILIENYTPASVLINDKGDILFINGKTGNFLELPAGEAVMNIYRMTREELKYALSNSIHHVKVQRNSITLQDIKLKEGSETRLANIHISFLESNILQGLILVVFEDKGLLKKIKKSSKLKRVGYNEVADALEKELNYTKQQLNSTIEQMETSLEELKSTNEELQSTNEELQSTNEEALTTKEEMQSLNEELMTINIQYQAKGEELTVLNNDMKNMLDNTEIGTIFLDNNLNILRFTPQIKKLFNLITSDIGRSITHIVSNLEHVSIENDLKEVIEKLVVKEMEVKTKNGNWYNLRIIPYRTLDNFISGAVLTIIDITSFKTLQTKLAVLKSSLRSLLDCSPHQALALDKSLSIVSANDQFLEFYELEEQEVRNISFINFVKEKWGIKNPETWLTKLRENCTPTKIEINTRLEGPKSLILTIKNCNSEDSDDHLVLITIQIAN
ncbi:MAG: Chemotaxis protein CheR, partial [Daejeonella sp.]|nr:Chemotaxis protein CheR [Daejeonella sp.]